MPKVIDLPSATSMNNNDYFIMESNGGGTKKITRSNALPSTNPGIRYTTTPTDLSTVASGQNVDVTSMTLEPGIWIITGQVKISGGDFNLQIGISGTSGDLQPSGGGNCAVRPTLSASVWTVIHSSRIVYFAAQTTVYLVCWQDSGVARSINRYDTGMRAVRVG